MQRADFTSQSVGADVRALRRARGLTLAGLSADVGRSTGWLSQVERGLSEPSIDDLRGLAARLDVPLSVFFAATPASAAEAGHVVRAAARRPLGARSAGLVETLLSPDLTDDFEVVHSTFAPHSRLTRPTTRPTQELGYLVSGALRITIADRSFDIGPGDSFRIRGEPFLWANPHDTEAVAIWVIAPPVY